MIHLCWQSFRSGGLSVVDHINGNEDVQPSIEVEEDADESAKVDLEDGLPADQIRATRKVNSIATIEALYLKPTSLSRMPVSL
jgi:hypothetical protein